jgi:hypothetical protein
LEADYGSFFSLHKKDAKKKNPQLQRFQPFIARSHSTTTSQMVSNPPHLMFEGCQQKHCAEGISEKSLFSRTSPKAQSIYPPSNLFVFLHGRFRIVSFRFVFVKSWPSSIVPYRVMKSPQNSGPRLSSLIHIRLCQIINRIHEVSRVCNVN